MMVPERPQGAGAVQPYKHMELTKAPSRTGCCTKKKRPIVFPQRLKLNLITRLVQLIMCREYRRHRKTVELNCKCEISKIHRKVYRSKLDINNLHRPVFPLSTVTVSSLCTVISLTNHSLCWSILIKICHVRPNSRLQWLSFRNCYNSH